MGNNNLKATNDILVKVDHNNLIYIDPNSVLNNGVVEPRAVQPENLVMFVNLEADLIPRTTLIANDNKSTITSIAKGTINFMQNQSGKDYDTTWTDTYTDRKLNITGSQVFDFGKGAVGIPIIDGFVQNDTSTQSFGIDNISIKVMGANFIPRVDIKFIDVRGKTLFESPANSPYAAFFHIPWPIFYLTVKGYYGKAIKYRLHLIKFNSKYNSTNGNFEIDCNFVGSTYAYLADIALESVLNAPYFYLSESTEDAKYNEKTGQYEKKINKTTKGYRVLRSVYQEYINKGFLPKEFPVRTLREIIVLAGKLNKIMERKLFNEIISYHTLAAVKEYEDDVLAYKSAVKTWEAKYLSTSVSFNLPYPDDKRTTGDKEDIHWYTFKTTDNDNNKKALEKLENIINTYVKKLENNTAFGTLNTTKSTDTLKIKTNTISCTKISNIKDFYRTQNEIIGFDITKLINEIDSVNQNFTAQRNALEDTIEDVMNETITKEPDIGLGFKPSVRNVIAIILANAETYIRLMKDVHDKAFEQAAERKKIFNDQSLKSSGVMSDGGNTIYPWPEVKMTVQGTKKENVLVYPGSKEMESKLRSYDKNLWPEVDFVENFIEIATKIKDNLSGKEGTSDNVQFVFGDTVDMIKKDTSVFSNVINFIPYTDKSISSIIYELYERAKVTTSLSPFTTDAIQELADVEYVNLKNQVSGDIDVVEVLKRNIKDYPSLISQMESNITKYPYYMDQIPTTQYILDGLDKDFSISKYTPSTESTTNNNDYVKLNNFLNNYKAENYRTSIYPFNSSTYKSYNTFDSNSLKLNRMLKVNAPDTFISSPLNPDIWIKDGFLMNMFTNTVKINDKDKHILNTPYFHKQLYNDFIKTQSLEKYVGSSYLFLNSLPYKDLDDVIMYGGPANVGTLVSSIFREIGSTHFIPYYMMLKWGSIYHRYKKYIADGVDIINNVTDRVDGRLFFDNNAGLTFTGLPEGKTISESSESDIGFHPYYETIFYQIANGYGFYNVDSQVSSYSDGITNGSIKIKNGIADGANTWASFIDNSKFNATDETYTLLPTNGFNGTNGVDFTLAEQENFRSIWGIGTEYTIGENHIDYTDYEFPRYKEYLKTTSNEFSLSTNYKKVVDLIATFKPDILETFELAFLDFASEKLNESSPYTPYSVSYSKFQDILKEITSVKKETGDSSENEAILYNKIKDRQIAKLKDISSQLKSNSNLIRLSLSNPREIDDHVFGGFTGIDVEHFSPGSYDSSQLGPNLNNIELYLGEDMDGYYRDFFSVNNIELNEDNIKQFRPLIYMYAGKRADGDNLTKSGFVDYLKQNVVEPPTSTIDAFTIKSPPNRLTDFLDRVIDKIQKDLEPTEELNRVSTITRLYNDDSTIKLENYNYFKSFNDKWTSGNSIGQRTLIEEFLFLDRANKDIGGLVYLNMEKLIRLGLPENAKINLYSAISLLIQDTGFDIRALPAYVNFYGTTSSNSSRVTPSKDVAKTMFGSFLDVDYQDATPKIILQYIGPTSKHPEMKDISKKTYLYNDDGFDIGRVNGNPIVVSADVFAKTDFSKSNKVVAFEVSFGDQNQSIFKSLELDQSTIRNTSESFYVIENLGRSEGGSSTAQVDIGLWNIYRQASYQCQVTCMGNVMIQPTMYFYLKNVPLFRGSYWITEVTHNIKPSGIETIFKGTRIPQVSLPDVDESFLASYRPLFDRIVKDAVQKVKEEHSLTQTPSTEKVAVKNSGTYNYDASDSGIKDEKPIDQQGVEPYGIPYNGFDNEPNIKKIEYKGQRWLRAKAIQMGSIEYPISDNQTMSIASKTILAGNVTWADVSKSVGFVTLSADDYYETKFNIGRLPGYNANILTNKYKKTEFLNPNPGHNDLRITIETDIDNVEKTYDGPVNVGPSISGYGIGLSPSLMKKLNLFNGEYVYFRLTE